MTISAFPSAIPETPETRTDVPALRRDALGRDDGSLASLPPGAEAVVASIGLEADLAAWVAAVGIRSGERLTVLRRAAFGGPIHVRTRAGGEFALARSLARAILVRQP